MQRKGEGKIKIKSTSNFNRLKEDLSSIIDDKDKKIIFYSIGILLIICFIAISIYLVNLHINNCNSIILKNSRYQCIYNLANQTKNASYCQKLPEGIGNSCVFNLAIKTKNVSYCSSSNTSNGLYSCISNYSYENSMPRDCNLIGNTEFRSNCIYNYERSIGFSNQSYCNQLSNSIAMKYCDDVAYYRYALKNDKPAYCSYLSNNTNNNGLQYLLNNSNTTSSLTLYYYFFNVTPEEYCYYSVGTKSKNMTICKLSGNSLSNLCYNQTQTNINYTNNNTLYCGNLTLTSEYPQIQELCNYSSVLANAIISKNVTKCYSLSTNLSYSCINSLATTYNDSNYCKLINNASAQQSCYIGTTNSSN